MNTQTRIGNLARFTGCPLVHLIGQMHWKWTVAFKDATAPTNARTMIAALVSAQAFGNTLPILTPESTELENYKNDAWLLASCLNSMAFDFVARQKVQGQHLSWYIVEQTTSNIAP